MMRVLKVCLIVVVGLAVVPSMTFAKSKSKHKTSEKAAAEPSKPSSDSEFEKTRQHMIEKNKESQRTGKM